MRRCLWVVIAWIFLPFFAGAQEEKVNCIKNPHWDEVLQMAREEKKMVFVDCGAVWCGPCKKFASEVLTNKKVAEYFNTHFVNVYLDVDKDSIPQLPMMPRISSIPMLLFIDADAGQVVHSFLGSLDAERLIALASKVLEGKYTIASLRERAREKDLSGKEMLLFMSELDQGGYGSEYQEYAREYLAGLTLDSLKSEENWTFCERELGDVLSPLFLQAWENREMLAALYGRERVMKKLISVMEYRLTRELNWYRLPEKFDSDAFARFTSLLLSVNNGEKEYYRLAIQGEQYARGERYDEVLATLKEVWRSSIPEDKKKGLTENFIDKIAYNVPETHLKLCINFLEKVVKRFGSAGTKGELLYLESKLWKMAGDEKKAKEVERRGVKWINPHFKG